ncbi:MAG: hypothetical protein WC624_04315, partial [Candidatus Margulisiibacteriota bacterium]
MSFVNLYVKTLPVAERMELRLSHCAFISAAEKPSGLLSATNEGIFNLFLVKHPVMGERALDRLELIGRQVRRMIFPRALDSSKHCHVIRSFLSDPAYAMSLVSEEGVLDFGRELKRYKQLDELRPVFGPENIKAMGGSVEIRTRNLYQTLMIIRGMLYLEEEKKSAASLEGNEMEAARCRAMIKAIAYFIDDFADNFPLRGIPYKGDSQDPAIARKLKSAAGLLGKGNTAPVDNSIRTLTDKLNNELKRLESQRMTGEKSARPPHQQKPKRSIAETLIDLAKRQYKIVVSPDGTYIIPQGTFKSNGEVNIRCYSGHRVPEEKVVRWTQHQIESISAQIAINTDFMNMLQSFVQILRSQDEIDYEHLKAGLEHSHENYKRGIVDNKFRASIFIGLAMQLIPSAERTPEKRILQFISDILEIAGNELNALNQILGNQLHSIALKQKVEEAIIANKLMRDANLLAVTRPLIATLAGRHIMNQPHIAWIYRNTIAAAISGLKTDDTTEPGLIRLKGRLKTIRDNLAMIGNLNQKKEKMREETRKVRRDAAADIHFFKERGQRDKLESSQRAAVDHAKRYLQEIKAINDKIALGLETAVTETLLLLYEIDHKNDAQLIDEDLEAYLAAQQETIDSVKRSNEGYQVV